ncbi:ABC transporter ATP-binding protein [Candidatus Woesebacteria bacterium]|nr:MAG: ABC transporter ATP-binding protein [Candidatus Woesebacteria bacterium]
MASILSLEKISKVYPMGDMMVHALREVSLEIKEGDFASITGPSGSGKSTLMHMIGLLDKPTSGRILLQGKNVSDLDENELAVARNKYIGFVFQSFNLLSKTSALDNVALPLLYAGVAKNERNERAQKALITVGLGDRLDHTSTQLSGGQQQRVAIARALVNDPRLILADEPTGNLDTKSGDEIMSLLKNLNKEGNTILLVTHEMEIAASTKRRIKIVDGEIVEDKKQ